MSSARRVSRIRLTPVDAPAHVTSELLNACARFSIIPHCSTNEQQRVGTLEDSLLQRIQQSRIALVTGQSGSGKSTLLRTLMQRLGPDDARVVPERLDQDQQQTAVFDLLDRDFDARASTLASAGLAEPRLWAMPAGMLSAGEKSRLRLAITMHHARPGQTLIADEFASNLDRVSAYALCRTVNRWANKLGVRFVAASAHEDLESMLDPDLVIDTQRDMSRDMSRVPNGFQEQPVVIEQGTRADYRWLEHLHYRSGPPATIVQILRALREVPTHIEPTGRVLAGVLLVSMPTLNGVWRKRAWPGHFDTRNKSLNTRRLNDQIRTISRVIVEPHSRGMGIATQLVRAYLHNPMTLGTEAVASMGSACPFFERAGMNAYRLFPDCSDTRLLDALDHLCITPESLMHTHLNPGSLLTRELITWGKARKILPKGHPPHHEVQRLTPIAACRLCSRPRAYAFVKGEHDHAGSNKPETLQACA